MTKRKLGPPKPKGAKKGEVRNPKGRPKGKANRVTTDARKAITLFIEGNVDQLDLWLKKIARTNPKGAFECFMSVVEYHIPKLNRTALVGEEDKPIGVLIIDNIPRPENPAAKKRSTDD